MKKTDLVIPPGMENTYSQFRFAPAVKVGNLLRCSGQLGTDESFAVISDVPAQFEAAFQNVRAVLKHAGLDFGDIVELTTFHVDLQKHLGAFMSVKNRFIAEPYPAWTAIGITELALPGALVEIRVTAALPVKAAAAKSAPKRAALKASAKKTRAKKASKKTTKRRR